MSIKSLTKVNHIKENSTKYWQHPPQPICYNPFQIHIHCSTTTSNGILIEVSKKTQEYRSCLNKKPF